MSRAGFVRPGWRRTLVALASVLAAAAAVALAWPERQSRHTLVAHFVSTVGIHEGSQVRVLGVAIGEVVRVRPAGSRVEVEVSYDARQPVPADVRAVIIPPSVVSDRYVQLTPAYAGGPVLTDGAEGDKLAGALRALSLALADITGFVRDNRELLKSNVEALTEVTGILVRQQRALVDVLDVAPLALSNLNLTYNARSATLDTRNNAMGPYDPASYVCSLLVDLVPLEQVPQECVALAETLKDANLPMTNQLRRLLGLAPLPQPEGSGGAGSLLPDLPDGSSSGDQTIDPTLGGILRGTP